MSQIGDINKSIAPMYYAVVNDCTWQAFLDHCLPFVCNVLLHDVYGFQWLERLASWLTFKSLVTSLLNCSAYILVFMQGWRWEHLGMGITLKWRVYVLLSISFLFYHIV